MRLDSGWGKQQIPHGLKAVRDDNSEIAKKGPSEWTGLSCVALAPRTAIRFDPLHWRAGHSYPTGTVLSTCSRTSSSCLASARLVGRAISSSSSMVLTCLLYTSDAADEEDSVDLG